MSHYMTTPTATPVAAPIDDATRSLLALIDADPLHATDRAVVMAAIRRTAAENDGVCDPNRLRALLHNSHGCIVAPGVIGATVNALRQAGVLTFAGWVETTGSTSRNNGRPARSWHWNGDAL